MGIRTNLLRLSAQALTDLRHASSEEIFEAVDGDDALKLGDTWSPLCALLDLHANLGCEAIVQKSLGYTLQTDFGTYGPPSCLYARHVRRVADDLTDLPDGNTLWRRVFRSRLRRARPHPASWPPPGPDEQAPTLTFLEEPSLLTHSMGLYGEARKEEEIEEAILTLSKNLDALVDYYELAKQADECMIRFTS